ERTSVECPKCASCRLLHRSRSQPPSSATATDGLAPFFYFLPYQHIDAHLAVGVKAERRSRIDDAFSVSSDEPHLRGAGPRLVHRYIDVMFDFRAVELVSSGVGRQGAEQISALLVGGFFDAFRSGSGVADDDDHYPSSPAVRNVTLRVLDGDDFSRIDDGPLLDDEFVRADQIIVGS